MLRCLTFLHYQVNREFLFLLLFPRENWKFIYLSVYLIPETKHFPNSGEMILCWQMNDWDKSQYQVIGRTAKVQRHGLRLSMRSYWLNEYCTLGHCIFHYHTLNTKLSIQLTMRRLASRMFPNNKIENYFSYHCEI